MRLQRSSPSPRYKSLQGFGKSGFSGEEYFRLLPLSVQEQFAARRRREIQEQAILRETSSGRALPSLWILVVLVLGGPGAIRAEAQAPAAPLLWKEYIYLGPRGCGGGERRQQRGEGDRYLAAECFPGGFAAAEVLGGSVGTVEHGGDLDDQSRGLWADHATRCDHSSLYGARHDHFQPAGHDYGDEHGGPYTERDGAGALLRSGVGDGRLSAVRLVPEFLPQHAVAALVGGIRLDAADRKRCDQAVYDRHSAKPEDSPVFRCRVGSATHNDPYGHSSISSGRPISGSPASSACSSEGAAFSFPEIRSSKTDFGTGFPPVSPSTERSSVV